MVTLEMTVNYDMERARNEAVLAYFKALCKYLRGETGDNYENPQSV
jgi:hypothetical protein